MLGRTGIFLWNYYGLVLVFTLYHCLGEVKSDTYSHNALCSLQKSRSFEDFTSCVKSRRFKRYNENTHYRYREDYGDPCHSYVKLNQPERRTTNQISALNDSALCDRTLRRRWYRFSGPGGGVMPENCIDENSCGTHSPIWMNGKHPTSYGDVVDREVCASLAGRCCTRRWYIRVAYCGDFYTYLLTDTPGCFMAYCAGSELPCPEGQSSPTGFSPYCSENFPELNGNAVLSLNTNDPRIVFNCDYKGTIRAGTVIDVDWFILGNKLSQGDSSKFPVYKDEMIERRRSVLTEGHWMGKMGSTVYCEMRARWSNQTGVPSPPIKSEKYFAGIKILKRVVSVSESEEETQIQLQSTMPVNCLPQFDDACKITVELAHDSEWQGKQCIDGKMNQVVFGDCKIDITPQNWRDVHNVSVKAVRDFYNDGNKKMHVEFKPVYSTYASNAWNDYQLPDVEVLTKDSPTAMCSSTGDPHYTTFDGHYYHVYLEGEFVLYKNTRFPYQINTRLENCGKVVTCNCAVAVKAVDDVIVVDRCGRRNRNLAYGKSFPNGWKTVHKHALEQGDEFTNGLKIYEHDDGRKYTVHLPSGAYLEFHVGDDWVNIFLHGSSDDYKSTLGLCGTFDGNARNDFTFPDGITQTIPRDDESCGDSTDVCKFSEAWRVSDADSYFGEVVEIELGERKPVGDQQYCKCQQRRGGHADIVCNYHYDVQNCEETEQKSEGRDKTDDFLIRSRSRASHDSRSDSRPSQDSRSSSRSGSRGKRSADLTDEVDDDYFNSEFVYDKNYVGQEPRWPTRSGITESYARNRCYAAIMFSDVGRICHRYVYSMLPKLIESCVIDIKVTDDFHWIQSSVDTLTSECTNHIHVNAAYWPNQYTGPTGRGQNETDDITTASPSTTGAPQSTPQSSIGNSVLSTICPASCSQHGRCVQRHCQCYRGYTGADCSISVLLPPKLLFVSENGLCDIRKRPCAVTTVYGANFRRSSSIECVFKEVRTGNKINMTAKFNTFEELKCELPLFHKAPEAGETERQASTEELFTHNIYELSVVEDGIESNEKKMVAIYDSKCQTYTIDENNNFHFSEKMDSCIVGGVCFADGEESSRDCCKVCNPGANRHEFVQRTEYILPIIYPSKEIYTISKHEDWYLTIGALGCKVSVSVTKQKSSNPEGQRRKGLEIALGADKVYVQNSGQVEGLFTFGVTATEACGGSSVRRNYTVLIAGSSTTAASPLCTAESNGPYFDEKSASVTVVEGELLKVPVTASNESKGVTLTYSVLKTTDSYVSISGSGLLRYIAPNSPGQEHVMVIVEDDCKRKAYKDVTLKTIACPCLNSGRCVRKSGASQGSHDSHDCQCIEPYNGQLCQLTDA